MRVERRSDAARFGDLARFGDAARFRDFARGFRGDAAPLEDAGSSSSEYAASAAITSTVAGTAEIGKRGKRRGVCEVTARDRKGRLVARGCVTKTLRGAAKL